MGVPDLFGAHGCDMSADTTPSTAALLRRIPAPPAPHTVEHGLFSSILGSAAASSGFHDAERKYTIIKSLGTGSFGTVYVADWHSALPSGAMVPAMQHSYTRPAYAGKRLVAIKRMKKPFASWDDCIKLNELRVRCATDLVSAHYSTPRPHYPAIRRIPPFFHPRAAHCV